MELRKFLESKGLPKHGNKSSLVERARTYWNHFQKAEAGKGLLFAAMTLKSCQCHNSMALILRYIYICINIKKNVCRPIHTFFLSRENTYNHMLPIDCYCFILASGG